MSLFKNKWSVAISVLLLTILGFTSKSFLNFSLLSTISQDTLVYNEQYYKLKKNITEYEKIAARGGWIHIPEIKDTLMVGDKGCTILLLKQRLAAENYILNMISLMSDSFDTEIETALKLFQANNGLAENGLLDASTISMLNIPIEKRIDQIKVNMERWKELPKDLGTCYLLVNVPNFKLTVFENDSLIMSMKVVVGQVYRKTPVFQARMTHIVFNPTWNIPSTIIKYDILPLVLKDTSYLRRKNIKIYKTDKQKLRMEIHKDSINWSKVNINYFPYELIQSAGKDNALGAIKFMFPNPYNVYMHDTPVRKLFQENEPTFSSGCIRVSDATTLAIYLLRNKEGWNKKRIMQSIYSGETNTVYLQKSVNVYIGYFTTWVDAKGMLQFRKDIYERDYL